MKKAFIICTIRGASEEYLNNLENYATHLEAVGYQVHLPHKHTNQKAKGFDICSQNKEAISNCDEVHVFYNSKSQGTHFDLGMAFAMNKPIVIVENEEIIGEGKSFPRMLEEWKNYYKKFINFIDADDETSECDNCDKKKRCIHFKLIRDCFILCEDCVKLLLKEFNEKP